MSLFSSISSTVRSAAQTATDTATALAKSVPGVRQQASPLGHSAKSEFVAAPSGTASTAAATANQKVDLSTPAGRESLVKGSSQANAVSAANMNSDSICGGAAMTNALVLSAKTPEAAKQNAAALRKTAQSLGIPPNREQEAALKAMESGKMSPTDMAHLQQLSYNVVKYADPMRNSALANSGEMAFAATMLRANGAFQQEPNVTFHNAQSAALGGVNHWTTTVGAQHADSMTGPTGGAAVGATPSSVVMDSQNAGWKGEVNVNNGTPPKVTMAYPNPGSSPATATFVEINDPAQFKMETFTDTQKAAALAQAIRNGQVIRLGHTVRD